MQRGLINIRLEDEIRIYKFKEWLKESVYSGFNEERGDEIIFVETIEGEGIYEFVKGDCNE